MADDAVTLGRRLRPDGTIGQKMRLGRPQHVLVFGPNGKGKGTRLLMPNLLQMTGASLVVVDPKGELAAVTAPYRRTLGPVIIINPFGVLAGRPGYEDLRSSGFNPLARLDPRAESFNVEAALIAEALITIGGKEPHWDESARSMVAACVMYAVLEAKEHGITPTMARVRELICSPSSNGDERLDMPPTGLPFYAEKMIEYGIPGLTNKASQFAFWTDEIRSIASSAKRQTEPFDDPEIASDLAKDGCDFRELKRRPITVYLILPPEMMQRHGKWLRMVLTSAIQGVLRLQEPGEPKTVFMIDEFAALGHLEIISTVWQLVRGYGIQMIPVLQDLPLLQDLYPKRWQTFIGMAGATLSFGPNDLTTAEWMSKRAGETTRMLAGYNSGSSVSYGQRNASQSSNSGLSYSSVKVPLITPHEMLGLAEGYAVVTLAGEANIIPAYVPIYDEIRLCRERARDNPYFQRPGGR